MPQRAGKRSVRTAEHRKEAIQLRIGGASYEQIGRSMGVSTRSAWRYVRDGLEETRKVVTEEADHLRAIELRRIDAQLLALWAQKSNPRASDSITRIGQRRDTLLGLNAPAQVQHSNPDGSPLLNELKVVFVKAGGE